MPVLKKRRLRLRRANHLLVPPNLRLKAKRPTTGSKSKPAKPDEWWGIDLTPVMVAGFGWIGIVVVLDCYPKKIVGHDAGVLWTATHWLATRHMAVNQQFPGGARGKGLLEAR
jgi:putative transposase